MTQHQGQQAAGVPCSHSRQGEVSTALAGHALAVQQVLGVGEGLCSQGKGSDACGHSCLGQQGA
jgi:hypothetical protein